MTDSACASPWPNSPLPSTMKAIFLSFPHTDSWWSSPATLQMVNLYIDSPSKKPISVTLAAINISVTLGCVLFPKQLPLFLQMSLIMLQCASSSGYIKFNVFHDEKLDMIVQMSSCPPGGVVMYTVLVVSLNCDIYGLCRRNMQALFLLCPSYTLDPFFPRG